MSCVFRALFDPFLEEFNFFGREFFIRIRRRHFIIDVRSSNAPDQLTVLRLAWNDGRVSITGIPSCAFREVEPQKFFATLPRLRIGAMASKTVFRKNSSDSGIVLRGKAHGCSQ